MAAQIPPKLYYRGEYKPILPFINTVPISIYLYKICKKSDNPLATA